MIIMMMEAMRRPAEASCTVGANCETQAPVGCRCIVEFLPSLSVRTLSHYVALAYPLVEKAIIIILIPVAMR